MNKIAAGYRFTFESTDIRNENNSIIIKEGLSQEQAEFFTELSEKIQGGTYLDVKSSHPQWRIKNEHEKLLAVFEKYPTLFSSEEIKEFKNDVGIIMDYISENMLGYSSEEEVNMRVLKTYKVEEIPQDILINDVTNAFKKKF